MNGDSVESMKSAFATHTIVKSVQIRKIVFMLYLQLTDTHTLVLTAISCQPHCIVKWFGMSSELAIAAHGHFSNRLDLGIGQLIRGNGTVGISKGSSEKMLWT